LILRHFYLVRLRFTGLLSVLLRNLLIHSYIRILLFLLHVILCVRIKWWWWWWWLWSTATYYRHI